MADEIKVKEEKNTVEKMLITSKIKGEVKWFSVRSGYGFIHREDVDEDIFVHSSSVVRPKVQSGRYFLNVRQGESVMFDVVKGEKGLEAASVTGADGEPLKSGEYSYRFKRGRGRSRGWRGGRGEIGEGPNSRGDGVAPYQNESPEFFRGGRGRGRVPRPFSGGMFVRGGGGGYGYGYGGYNAYHQMPYRGGRGGFRDRPMYNEMGYNSFGPMFMAENYRGGRRSGFRNRGYRSRGFGRGKNENYTNSRGNENNGGQNSESGGEEFANANENTQNNK